MFSNIHSTEISIRIVSCIEYIAVECGDATTFKHVLSSASDLEKYGNVTGWKVKHSRLQLDMNAA